MSAGVIPSLPTWSTALSVCARVRSAARAGEERAGAGMAAAEERPRTASPACGSRRAVGHAGRRDILPPVLVRSWVVPPFGPPRPAFHDVVFLPARRRPGAGRARAGHVRAARRRPDARPRGHAAGCRHGRSPARRHAGRCGLYAGHDPAPRPGPRNGGPRGRPHRQPGLPPVHRAHPGGAARRDPVDANLAAHAWPDGARARPRQPRRGPRWRA